MAHRIFHMVLAILIGGILAVAFLLVPHTRMPAQASLAPPSFSPNSNLAVMGIHPPSAPNDLDVSVTITGTGFATGATALLGETLLRNVRWVNATTLTALVPWGLEPGVYTLMVVNPDGISGTLLNAFTVTQGIGVWTTGGPYGGAVTTLLINPVTPTILYATVQAPYSASGVGLFRSLDGGMHWEMILAEIEPQYHAADLSSPAPSVIYVSKWEAGLYRSDDGGKTWVALPTPEGVGRITPYAHPTDPQVVYLAANCAPSCGGIYKSNDQGSHWASCTSGITDTQITTLAFDPINPQIMYAGTANGNVFRSVNGGASWEFIGQPDRYIGQLAVNPFGTREPWACGASSSGHWGHLWRYVSGSWERVTPGTGLENSVAAIAFDRNISGAIWIGTLDGGFKSTNGGLTWMPFGALDEQVIALAVDPTNSRVVYQGYNGVGVFKTENDGVRWQEVNEGLAGFIPNGLALVPGDPATLYAISHGVGIFKTNNGGNSWLNIPTDNLWPRTPIVDPVTPTRIYIGGTQFVQISEDDGITWRYAFPQPPPAYASCCRFELLSMIATSQPGLMFMGGGFIPNESLSYNLIGGGIYSSTDFGETWFYIDVGQEISPVITLASNPFNPKVVYAGTENRMWRTTDGGTTWSSPGFSGQRVTGIAVDPRDARTVYAVADSKFYTSSDSGQTWELVAELDLGLHHLLFVPATPPAIYVYGWNGMMRSTDGGEHWERPATALASTPIGSMTAAVTWDRVIVYVGTAGGIVSNVSAQGRDQRESETSLAAGVYRHTTQRMWPVHLYLPLVLKAHKP